MTFLSPAFLWLLPLITLPVIIHLLAKRKSKLIDFPSLKFLKLLEQDALKKFNVKQLILLIIRTLMILFLILAFARPNLNLGDGFKLYSKNVDLLIVALDNTASNRDELQSLSESWLDRLSKDLKEKGYHVLFCGITDFNLDPDFKQILPEYGDVYSGNLLEKVTEQIDLERFRRKSMLWIGDGQDIREQFEELEGWSKFVLLGDVQDDYGISDIQLPILGIREGETYQMQVDIEHAITPGEVVALELTINESRQNQTVVLPDVPSVELVARVSETGFQNGRLELGPDGYQYNDLRYYVIPAAGNIPVQILRTNQTPDFWNLVSIAASEKGINLDIRLLSYRESENLTLNQGGTVIVDDASKLADYNWKRLEGFVAQGGQLIVFGAGGVQLPELLNFKAVLKKDISTYPLGLYVTPTGQQALKSSPIDAVIDESRLKVYERYTSQTAEMDETWIRYLDNQPFLGSSRLGQGRIIWFNTDFGTQANNLPLLGIFPTLVLQLCQAKELNDHTAQYNAEIGDTLLFFPEALVSENTPFSIQRPDGTVDYLTPDSNYVIYYAQADIPGIYSVSKGRQILQTIAVNISSHEAQAHSRTYELMGPELFVSRDQEEITSEILNRHSGIAIWPILLILLLVLQVVETYLSRIKSTWR